jgi:Matrixin
VTPRWPGGLAFALALAVSCRTDGDSAGQRVDYLGDTDLVETPCAVSPAAPALAGRLRLALFVGEGIDAGDLAQHTRDAAGLFGALGLELEIDGPPARLSASTAFLGEAEGVSRRVTRGDTRFAAPLMALLRDHGSPRPGTINVVLLGRIASASSAVAVQLQDLAGLTITHEVASALGLGERPLRPTILLSLRDLQRAAPLERRTTLAHEIGHALGLDHRRDPQNLMTLHRPVDCRPVLDAEQRKVAAAGLLALSRPGSE